MVKGNNNFMPNLWINEGYLYTFHIFISLPEYTLKVSAHESLCHDFCETTWKVKNEVFARLFKQEAYF